MHWHRIMTIGLGMYSHVARLIATITSTSAGIVTAATPRVTTTIASDISASVSVPFIAAACTVSVAITTGKREASTYHRLCYPRT
jgi:type III secretory pathway component EscV